MGLYPTLAKKLKTSLVRKTTGNYFPSQKLHALLLLSTE